MQTMVPGRVSTEIVTRRLGECLLDRVGNTPMLCLPQLASEFRGVQLLAKAEWFNPGGSVKDRAAANIVRAAIRSGRLGGKKTLLDATSGNTGIAYAMLGAALGFPVTLCVPANASAERKRILCAYGAHILYTEAGEGTDGAIRKAREVAQADPELYFYADQYSNEANWRAHYHGTAHEIWKQTEGRITHFVAMLGTTGTFVGTARRLKELNPQIRCISLQPDSPFHGIEGSKHLATNLVPSIYDPALADENLAISTEEAHGMVKRLARGQGLLVGISAGGALAGCLAVARSLTTKAIIVTILPDSADKYLSERFWEE